MESHRKWKKENREKNFLITGWKFSRYDESFKLSSESNDELLSFPGYRISYLTKYNEIGVKVLVKGINIDYKFVFDSFTE